MGGSKELEMFSKAFSVELVRIAIGAGYTPATKVRIEADEKGNLYISKI